MKRSNRRRGRSLLPRDASLHSVAPYPLPVPASENPSDVDDDPLPKKKQSKAFEIQETDKVTAFLVSRLKRMQQLADKKIAKAWIKGICPKKQAKFPYQNNKKDIPDGAKEKPLLPGWWPDPNTICQFKEPDHIKRDGMFHPEAQPLATSADFSRAHETMPPPSAPSANSRATPSLEPRQIRAASHPCDPGLDGFPQGARRRRDL